MSFFVDEALEADNSLYVVDDRVQDYLDNIYDKVIEDERSCFVRDGYGEEDYVSSAVHFGNFVFVGERDDAAALWWVTVSSSAKTSKQKIYHRNKFEL